jgi:hypothetical protein
MKHRDLVYVVHARRLGFDDTHSYIVGVFKNERKAVDEAEKEEKARGNKYLCDVLEFELGVADDNRGKVVRSLRGLEHLQQG